MHRKMIVPRLLSVVNYIHAFVLYFEIYSLSAKQEILFVTSLLNHQIMEHFKKSKLCIII